MLKRREFLRATVVTAGVLVTGCSDDETVTPKDQPPRELTPGEAYFPQSIASGDPRPASVILWTRLDDPAATGDLSLDLEIALDEAFTSRVAVGGAETITLTALATFDHCVKARVTGLAAGTLYYYRFVYPSGGKNYVSRVGRTKTAPAEDADTKVRFAVVSCQDFIGKYYNNYLALAQEEFDFFVHLGDYVYETTGDPTFQTPDATRKLAFTDEAGAIALTTGAGDTFHAASSLDNYRQLYKTYRGDAHLQAVHEKYAMIATWDDHEFSDDCHGETATYFDGKEDEADQERRKHANQAWFEYMPVDFQDPQFRYDPQKSYPDDITIYRDLVFGKHVHLVMTDLRTYRADHLIPEQAFPGTVVVTQAELEALGPLPAVAKPYVDVETFGGGAYKTALAGAAATLGYDAAAITGNLSVAVINGILADLPASPPPPAPIDDADPTLEKGFSFADLGKNGYYGSIGSRYFVIKDTYDTYTALKYAATAGASEAVMGDAQEAWFLSTIGGSTRTWKVWGNEYCLTPLMVDLRAQALPEPFQRRFTMNADAWDGFRNKRSELIAKLSDIGNVVAVTGDVHAFYCGTPVTDADPAKKIHEFVTSSISSTTFKEELGKQVLSDPILSQVPGASALAAAIDTLLLSKDTKANPFLTFADSGRNGFMIVEAGADELVVTLRRIASAEVATDYTDKLDELLGKYKETRFRALPGDKEIYQEEGGAWKKWDPETQTLV